MTNMNLGRIPEDFDLAYGTGKQIIFLDTDVVRTPGKQSIRLEPHTSLDTNNAREVNGTWYPIKPGDHIVAKCWMKLEDGRPYDPYSGARIGIDLYSSKWNSAINRYPLLGPFNPAPDTVAQYVHWGSQGWVQRVIDFVVPDTFFTKDMVTGQTIVGEQASSFVMWLQVWSSKLGGTEQGNAWFADSELYINPEADAPPQAQNAAILLGLILILLLIGALTQK